MFKVVKNGVWILDIIHRKKVYEESGKRIRRIRKLMEQFTSSRWRSKVSNHQYGDVFWCQAK